MQKEPFAATQDQSCVSDHLAISESSIFTFYLVCFWSPVTPEGSTLI